MEEHRMAPKTPSLSFPGMPRSASCLSCPSVLIRVLALVPVTDCKWREARRVQPPKMPQPAPHRAPAVASREIWGPAPHLYLQEGPHGTASSPYLPKGQTSHLGTAMASPVLPSTAVVKVPPSCPVPPLRAALHKHLQAGKQPGEGGGPREQEGVFIC